MLASGYFLHAYKNTAGIKEAASDGAYQKSIETAKNLLGLGLSVENIAQATGLSKEEVEALN